MEKSNKMCELAYGKKVAKTRASIPKETPWKTLALNERCGHAPRI